jgi:hypothetical protein
MNASLTAFKLPSQGQHERVFLEDAIKKYKARLLTPAGYIDTICRIYRAEGHRLNIRKPRQFYEYFGIPKSTFYRALSQLEATPEIGFNWEPMGGISIWWQKPTAAPEPIAASVEPAAAPEPIAASVEPVAAPEPIAASVEPVAAPEPAAASVEPVAASVEPVAASVEPTAAPEPIAASVEPTAAPEPVAASVEPVAASVEPVAASVEPTAAPEPIAASVEPTAAPEPVAASVEPVAASVEPVAVSVEPVAASEPQRFNQIPPSLRSDFEAFVRSQWKKMRGQEIRSFHTFVEKAANFKAWWEKFSSQPIHAIEQPMTNISKFADDDDRVSPEQFRQLRQLIASKK